MLKRTHLALGIAVAFYFVPHIRFNKLMFLIAVIIASVIPDIESGFTAEKKTHRFLKIFSMKNRFLHSYTFLIPASIVVALIYPPLAFPFFLGYSFHLFLDAFTPEGVRPFWPLKSAATGSIHTGGKIDWILFRVFIFLDFAFFIKLFI